MERKGGESVTLPARIVALLKRVESKRLLLAIRIPGLNETFNSMVIDVKPEDNVFVIDALQSPQAHARLKQVKKFHAETRLDGVDMSFSGVVANFNEDSRLPSYEISLPESIYYGQRREAHRVALSGQVLLVAMTMADGKQFQTEVVDLSATGMRFKLPPGAAAVLGPGSIVPVCSFTLPTGEEIAAPLEIRSLQESKNKKSGSAGGRFVEPEQRLLRTLERFITALDREQRKNKKTD